MRHTENCPHYNDFVKLFHDGGYQPANPGKRQEIRNKISEAKPIKVQIKRIPPPPWLGSFPHLNNFFKRLLKILYILYIYNLFICRKYKGNNKYEYCGDKQLGGPRLDT